MIFPRKRNLRVCLDDGLLGQSSVTATSAYLGVSDNSALELARSINV